MNAPVYPEVLARREGLLQMPLPLATEGVLRYVWESRYGPILVEVVEGQVFVNGDRVDLMPAPAA